jgi:protein TonB
MKKTLLLCLFIICTFIAKAQTADSASNTNKASLTLNSGDIPPSFPGGIDAWNKYLAKNLRYPYDAVQNNSQGIVFVRFVIEPDGSITSPTVMRGVSKDIDAEAIKVISKSPKWNPGIQNGKPVRVYYTVPVRFSLTRQ